MDGAVLPRDRGEPEALGHVAGQIGAARAPRCGARSREARPTPESSANRGSAPWCSRSRFEVEVGPVARRPGEAQPMRWRYASSLSIGAPRDEISSRRAPRRCGTSPSSVGDRGVDRAAGLVARAEHEVVDQQLRSAVEQFGQRRGSVLGLQRVLLVDAHPRKLPPQARELVAPPGVLLLAGEQLPRGRRANCSRA